MKKLFLLLLSVYSFTVMAQDCNQFLIDFQKEFIQKNEDLWSKITYGTSSEASKYDRSKFESARKYITYYLACKADEIGYDNPTLNKLRNCIDFIYRDETNLIIAGEYDQKKSLNAQGYPNRYYVINSKFEIVREYDKVWDISSLIGDKINKEIYFVEKNKKQGIIDKYGNEIVTPDYDEVSWFVEDRAIIKNNGKEGVIDTKGNIILAPKYDGIAHYTEEYARVSYGKDFNNFRVGLMDKKGNEIISPQYYDSLEFFGGLFPVANKDFKWGFVNTKNEIVIPFKFGMAGKRFGYTERGVWYYEIQKKFGGNSEFVNKKGETFKSLTDVRD